MENRRNITGPNQFHTHDLKIRDVWSYNLHDEMLFLNNIISTHRLIAFDTEFPGFVYPSPRDASEYERYDALVENVNGLKIIQLGLVLFNERGSIGACWQFNFSDFDVKSDQHVTESITLLRKNGIDFEKNRKEGVCSEIFAEILNTVLSHYSGLRWVTFHGIYDIAYLSKLLLKKEVPSSGYDAFGKMVGEALGGELFDAKLMGEYVFGQEGSLGLEKLSKKLSVERVGAAHQAGSDSLLTAKVFLKLCDGGFGQIHKLIGGYLYGITFKFSNRPSLVQLRRQQRYLLQNRCYIPIYRQPCIVLRPAPFPLFFR